MTRYSRSWIVTTRRKRPRAGAVLASECRTSIPARRAKPRQQLLLAAHPLDAVAREDRDLDDRRRELVPLPARRARLAVDERGHAQVGPHGGQRAQQLAGVDLHPALLAGHEEDEVQADVHADESRKPRGQ